MIDKVLFAERFERRSTRLQKAAALFLFAAFMLLGAGVFAVIYAPTITARDIGPSASLDERLQRARNAIDEASAKEQQLNKDLGEMANDCRSALADFFAPWPSDPNAKRDDGAQVQFAQFPDQKELAARLSAVLQERRQPGIKLLGLQIAIDGCNQPFPDIVRPLDQWESIIGAILTKTMPFDRDKFNNMRARREKAQEEYAFRLKVYQQVYASKVAAAADGKDSLAGNDLAGEQNLSFKLIQTSITRFGLLAVIGFFVALLVSLYRYNVRLAAYYTARADFFHIFSGETLTSSETSAMIGVLTPGIEFGKPPATPASQILDLLRVSSKEAKGD